MIAVPLAALGLSSCGTFAEMMFPKEASERLQHFAAEAPSVGEPAPRFELTTTEDTLFDLEDAVGDKPVVLVFGSHTCPVFRYRGSWLRALERDYADKVRFAVVYTLEAHPVGAPCPYTDGEWDPLINKLAGVRNAQADSFEQRRVDAERAKQDMGFASPVLVDDIENRVWKQFGRAPAAAFLLDRAGRVALRQVWFDPDRLRSAIDRVLEQDRVSLAIDSAD